MLDDVLEELYMLLDLYFENYRVSEGLVKASGDCTGVRPQLDSSILKEELLNRIQDTSQKLHSL